MKTEHMVRRGVLAVAVAGLLLRLRADVSRAVLRRTRSNRLHVDACQFGTQNGFNCRQKTLKSPAILGKSIKYVFEAGFGAIGAVAFGDIHAEDRIGDPISGG